jgi:serine/threonine-protein kinase
MGTVFVGQDRRLGKPVAIKVLLASLAGRKKAETAARMIQEAHAAARVNHPALVQMLDIGSAPNGDPYLVMELLQGESMGTMLAGRGFLEPIEAVQILLPVAHGLATAHGQNVVHRDLKPENILLAYASRGRIQPKVIDFGLAKAEMENQRRLTRKGKALGTPEYMAPEQVRGEDVTHLADVWGFSVLLYELITGEAPFRGSTLPRILRRILSADPVPTTHHGAGDEALWAIVKRGLAKVPEERWPSMAELGRALARWLLNQGVKRDVRGKNVEKQWLRSELAVVDDESTAGDLVEPGASAPGVGSQPGLGSQPAGSPPQVVAPPAVPPAAVAPAAGSARSQLASLDLPEAEMLRRGSRRVWWVAAGFVLGFAALVTALVTLL